MVLHETGDRASLADLRDRRLHVAGRIDGAALDDGRGPVPGPAEPEAGEALVDHRLFQRRLVPVLPAVHRDVDGGDLAAPRPRESLDLVRPGAGQLHAPGGTGDDRLGLHDEAELPPLALGHRVGVARGLAPEVPGLVARLYAP